MIEEHYLMKIWQVLGLKENQNLTAEEQQSKIRALLISFKKEVNEYTKKDTKRKIIEEFTKVANCL